MADRPIIFSRPMIHALLAGRKTQTRRVLKPQPPSGCACIEPHSTFPNEWVPYCGGDPQHSIAVPYAAGDRLWVRETWNEYPEGVDFAADLAEVSLKQAGPWRSPIHLPRAYSRLTLTVTQVRVERLQMITADDATEEGVHDTDFYDRAEHKVSGGAPYAPERLAFADLWNSIHGPDAWDANPWVVALTFGVVERNIDEEPA